MLEILKKVLIYISANNKIHNHILKLLKPILESENIKFEIENFNKNTISIGKDLALSLDLKVGDQITLMSSSGIETIIGNLPKQEGFIISSIFFPRCFE